jgi:hypothetical protein
MFVAGAKQKRNDFSSDTVRVIGDYAGWLCSNPNCRIATVGPGKASNRSERIGQAAHIYAASPRGPGPHRWY